MPLRHTPLASIPVHTWDDKPNIIELTSVSDGTLRLIITDTPEGSLELVLTKEQAAEIVAAYQSVLGPVR